MKTQSDNQTPQFERILLVVVALLLVPVAWAYLATQSGLGRQFDVPAQPLEIAQGEAAIAEGERLANIRGCFWCHGDQLGGEKYFANADRGIIAVAPDLTMKIREYSPADFARAVRNGVRPDGTSLQLAMPSFAFYNMSDDDMAKIMAYIASVPEQNGLDTQFDFLPVGWFRYATGDIVPPVADVIDHNAPRPESQGSPEVVGRYLAESVCTECHGDNGRYRVPVTPNLEIALAYDREQFFHLMRTGEAIGQRPIDHHMKDVGRYRYIYFSDAEVEALYTYLQTLAQPAAEPAG